MGRKLEENLLKIWILLSVLWVGAMILFILIYTISRGLGSISKEFLLSSPQGLILGSEGGIFPAIIGSLLLTLIACTFSGVLAIGTAIYLKLYCKSRRLMDLIHLIIHCTAGIPSIVLGLFGYTFLVYRLGLGMSLLAGGITLGIMIFPYIEVRVEKIIHEIEVDLLEASYALGISKSYTFFRLILPMYQRNIISTITMAGGFAMGATAPIILTAAVIFADVPNSILSPVMALPFHLYILLGEGISVENAYGTALVLVAIIILLNMVSLIGKPSKGRK